MKLLSLIVICLMLNGCASIPVSAKRQISYIPYNDTEIVSKETSTEIKLFFNEEPLKKYTVIGEIHGYVAHEENIRPMLKEKVRQVGGDGLIDIQIGVGSVSTVHTSYTPSKTSYNLLADSVVVTPSSSHSYQKNIRVHEISGKVIKFI